MAPGKENVDPNDGVIIDENEYRMTSRIQRSSYMPSPIFFSISPSPEGSPALVFNERTDTTVQRPDHKPYCSDVTPVNTSADFRQPASGVHKPSGNAVKIYIL